MSSALQIADELRTQARQLMLEGGVEELLTRYGELYYAGSYALDLMAWKDIDMNLIINDPNDRRQAAAELAKHFILLPEARRVLIDNSLHEKYAGMPQGTCLSVKMGWKLDIWLVDAATSAQTERKTEWVREHLSPHARSIIVSWKQRHLLPSGRTPKFSGHWLYQAVLGEGLESDADICAYLTKQGVCVD